MTQGYELRLIDRAMDDINNSGSYAQSSICYEQLRAMYDMNDSRL